MWKDEGLLRAWVTRAGAGPLVTVHVRTRVLVKGPNGAQT